MKVARGDTTTTGRIPNYPESMSTNATDLQERTAVRPKTIFLGTDADGSVHYYRTRTETVHVVDEAGRREHVERIPYRPVDEWMAFVEGRRGWASKHYGVDLVELLAQGLRR